MQWDIWAGRPPKHMKRKTWGDNFTWWPMVGGDRYPAAERSRRLAERVEGLSTLSDGDGYGLSRKPFGTFFTGASLLRMARRGR